MAGGVESISLVQPKLNTNDYTEGWLMVHKPEMWMPMLQTAEIVAQQYRITREMQDEYALVEPDAHRSRAAARAGSTPRSFRSLRAWR